MNYKLEKLDFLNKKIIGNLFSMKQKGLSIFVILSMVLSISTSFVLYPSVIQAAIVFTNSSTDDNGTSGGSSISIPAPSGISLGDLLLASISVSLAGNSNSVITAPAGWNSVLTTTNANNVQISTYYKVAGSSEPLSYAWSLDHNFKAVGGILHYTGTDASNPIDASGGNTGNSGTSKTPAVAPSVTTTIANDEIVALFAADDGSSLTIGIPSGMSQRYAAANQNNHGPSIAADDAIQALTGATGTKSASLDQKNDNWSAQTIAIAPAKTSQTIIFNPLETKTYGDADFTVSATASSGLTVTFTASGDCTVLATMVHLVAAGSCTITAHQSGDGIYAAAPDVPQTFSINQKSIAVVADNKSKNFGDPDPALTYQYTGSLVGTDAFTGSLMRVAGEDVGTYAIEQGTLTLGSNYLINFTGANFIIGTETINVTANAVSKVYGDSDPALTYTSNPALQSGDSFSGSLVRAAGENAGNYAITQGTLTAGSNYTINFTGAEFTITPKALTVTAATDTKIYDGTTVSAGIPTFSPALLGTDSANFSQSFDNKNVGTGKVLTPSGTVSDGNSGNNYAVTFVTNTTGVITTRPITVTAVTDTKVFDGTTSSSKVPTITVGSLADSDTATWTQTFNTSDVGTGKILIPAGTVSDGNSGNNYTVTFVNDTTGVITAVATPPPPPSGGGGGGGGGGGIGTYSVFASAGPNGTITPSGSLAYSPGANQTFTITPDVGFQVSNVLVDNVSVGAVTTYTLNNINGNHTILANFSVIPQVAGASTGPTTQNTPTTPTTPTTSNTESNSGSTPPPSTTGSHKKSAVKKVSPPSGENNTATGEITDNNNPAGSNTEPSLTEETSSEQTAALSLSNGSLFDWVKGHWFWILLLLLIILAIGSYYYYNYNKKGVSK